MEFSDGFIWKNKTHHNQATLRVADLWSWKGGPADWSGPAPVTLKWLPILSTRNFWIRQKLIGGIVPEVSFRGWNPFPHSQVCYCYRLVSGRSSYASSSVNFYYIIIFFSDTILAPNLSQMSIGSCSTKYFPDWEKRHKGPNRVVAYMEINNLLFIWICWVFLFFFNKWIPYKMPFIHSQIFVIQDIKHYCMRRGTLKNVP